MILVLDGNELLMKSVFIWRRNKNIPISYFLLRQVFKYINMFNPEQIYIAADSGGSWRKEIYPKYKANRKEHREKYPDINWEDVFAEYSVLLKNMKMYTPITPIQIYSIEGDDIISYICRYEGSPVTVISQDRDIQQLLILPNVEIYSPRKKEIIKPTSDTVLIVDTKIKEGDEIDNIPKPSKLSEYIRNQILIDLVNLPTAIDSKIREYLDGIKKNKDDYQKFLSIYTYKFLPKEYNKLIGKKEV